MKSFSKISSKITPFDKANVDTDQIIPKQFLKLITKSGFGKFLFYDWRFDQDAARWRLNTVFTDEKKFVNSVNGWKLIT